MKHRTRGFTLIELLVVIAIIGVLASIVLASLNSARKKSRDARRITDIKQIQLALELAYDAASPPAYPVAVAPDTGCANKRGLNVLATGGYIPQVPVDPQGGCYLYSTRSSSITRYHLGATLEEASNPALNSDKDCDDVSNGCGFTAVASTGFDGNGSGANGDETTAPVYDVVP